MHNAFKGRYLSPEGLYGYLKLFLNNQLHRYFGIVLSFDSGVYLLCCLLVGKTPYVLLMQMIKRGVLFLNPISFVDKIKNSNVLGVWWTSRLHNWKMSFRITKQFPFVSKTPASLYNLCHIRGSTCFEFPDAILMEGKFFLSRLFL